MFFLLLGGLTLRLELTNYSPEPLHSFAIQFNQNSFGLSPGPVECVNVPAGKTGSLVIDVQPNVLNSNNPPTTPLMLQVKTFGAKEDGLLLPSAVSMCILYFSWPSLTVPFVPDCFPFRWH